MLEKGNRANALHGILLIALFSFAAFYIAEIPFVRRLSFSPLIVGIILGMLYANSLRNKLPETWVPGIKFCTKQILRWGIILYGFRLTLAQVAAVGLPALTVDLIVVAVTILGGVALGRYVFIAVDNMMREPVYDHEYGHVRQSMYLGPLWLLVVALPSGIHCLICRAENYYHFYTERWANALGGIPDYKGEYHHHEDGLIVTCWDTLLELKQKYFPRV